MRVVQQLISHLRGTGHLSAEQLDTLRDMGLLLPDEPTLEATLDWDADEQPSDATDDLAIDELDAHGDALIAAATRPTRRHRTGERRPPVVSRVKAALERNLAEQDRVRSVLAQIARRLDPRVGPDDAAAAIAAATVARLVDVLTRDDLWARCWVFLEEDVFAGLYPHERRYLHRLFGVGHDVVPAPLAGHRVTRHTIALIEAHRRLSQAFRDVWSTLEPARVGGQLDLAEHPLRYEAMVILHSARAPRRTIADLPGLPAEVGLPSPKSLPRNPFTTGWDIAARIDPIPVLAYLQWCTAAWALDPEPAIRRVELRIDGTVLAGGWTNGPLPSGFHGWYGLNLRDGRWVHTTCTVHDDAAPKGTVSQRITHEGILYLHTCVATNCTEIGRRFTQEDATGRLGMSWWNARHSFNRPPPGPAAFGERWERGFLASPLLTCPKEWEYP